MRKKLIICALAATLLTCVSCSQHYYAAGFERSRILIDSVFDGAHDEALDDFIAPYKRQVDSIMSPVVGRAAGYMAAERPESKLSNLLADILLWGGKDYDEKPDFAVYNMGGIRSALAEGDITYGDVLDVAPFENKICFVTLTGDKVTELFRQMAAVGGEAVSHGVELIITSDGRLKSAKLHGKAIDPKAEYRVATLDYLAQGNDKMTAFKSSTNVKSPTDKANNVRFIIMKYMKEKMEQGISVDAKIEGRIIIADK